MHDITNDTILALVEHFRIAAGISRDEAYEDPTSLYTTIHDLLAHPLHSGAIIMCCFLAPITKEDEQKIKLEAYMKEINTMDTEPYFPDFDYSVFFGNYTGTLHPSMNPNPQMARVVHESIQFWINSHSAKFAVHYPAISSKLLPRFTRADMDLYILAKVGEPSVATQGVLEYLYMKYGDTMEGPCEIKQRWYTNGLKPRTYFVCGPTLYNATKYTKHLWNDLCDALVITHRRNRVNPRRISILHTQRALFYDLSTFTSNCAAQRSFLQVLACHCDGVPFSYHDGLSGICEGDLGQVIRTYCESCVQPHYAFPDKEEEFVHGVAGFLGVYGNIATCTFLHGAFLLQLADSTSACGCAGDDAVLATHKDAPEIWKCVSLIGVLAVEKTFSSDDPDCVYLKRRTWISQRGNLDYRTFIQLPSFLSFLEPMELSRFREKHLDGPDMKVLAANSISALFRSAAALKDKTTMEDLRQFAKSYYEALHFPVTGNVPQFQQTQSKTWHSAFIPAVDTIGSRDFIQETIMSLYPGYCFVDVRPIISESYPLYLQDGQTFRARRSPTITLLLKTGFIRKLPRQTTILVGDIGLKKLLDLYLRRDDEVNFDRYMVVEDVTALSYHPEVIGEYDTDNSFDYILGSTNFDDQG